jgi:hypothetical protein
MNLNERMEFDHVIRIHDDGLAEDVYGEGIYAPELSIDCDDEGQISTADDDAMWHDALEQGWVLLTGHTGQWGYKGPLMHSSEYVGGGLERAIRDTPGYYVCVAINDRLGNAAGWVVAFREAI